MVCLKALQDRCVAREGVVSRVKKHNATLKIEQGQYKEAIRMFNQEVKELKGKLEEVECQKQKLQEEVTALHEKVKTAGINAVQKFKTS